MKNELPEAITALTVAHDTKDDRISLQALSNEIVEGNLLRELAPDDLSIALRKYVRLLTWVTDKPTEEEVNTFSTAWQNAAEEQMHQFGHMDLARSIKNIQKLNAPISPAFLSSFKVSALLVMSAENENERFSLMDLADLYKAFGRMEGNEKMQEKIEQQMQTYYSDPNAPVLPSWMFIEALDARLEFQPPPSEAFLSAWNGAFTNKSQAIDEHDIERSKGVLTKAGIAVEEQFWGEHAHPSADRQPFIDALTRGMAEKDTRFQLDNWTWDLLEAGVLPGMDAKNLSLVLARYGQLASISRIREPNELLRQDFLTQWETAATPVFQEFNARDLSDTIYGFSKLNEMPSHRFYEQWETRCTEQMAEFSARDLASTLLSCARLRLDVTDDFIDAWQHAAIIKMTAIDRSDEFGARDLSDAVFSLGKLARQPNPDFVDAWERETISKLGEFNSQDLSGALFGYGKLGMNPSEPFLDAWMQAMIDKIEESRSKQYDFSHRDLASCAFRLAEISSTSGRPASLPDILVEEINSRSGFDPEARHQLYLVDQHFRAQEGAPLFHLDYEQVLRESAQEHATTSGSELAIFNTLLQSRTIQMLHSKDGIELRDSAFVDPIASRVDISFHKPYEQNPRLVVQVDGPFHFVKTPQGDRVENGSTRFQNLLLGKHGIPVIRINLQQLEALGNNELDGYFQALLTEIQEKVTSLPQQRGNSGRSTLPDR